MKFVKMQGAGNDYIFIEDFEEEISQPEKLSRLLSNRHFGVGGDGVVLVRESFFADAKMEMFNADGSEGKMCGNAIRCVAKLLFDRAKRLKNLGENIKKAQAEKGKYTFFIETASGIKSVCVHIKKGQTNCASVNMGTPIFELSKIPSTLNEDQKLNVDGEEYEISAVSMGNPHCVVFLEEDVDLLDLSVLGPKFENHSAFPDRTNTEFVNFKGKNAFKVRVWERGSGETLACGTGACAVAAVAVKKGWADSKRDVVICLRGGKLKVSHFKDQLFLKGEAQTIFSGEVSKELLSQLV